MQAVAIEFEKLLDRLRPRPEDLSLPDEAPEEPEDLSRHPAHPAWNRTLKVCPAPAIARVEAASLDEAREMIEREILAYLKMGDPTFALLVKAPPGTGKTTIGVMAAEMAATMGWRVLYAGPRHDFFGDVKLLARHPDWWYEWLPRQQGHEEKGIEQTCAYAPYINSWMAKGYPGMEFCRGVCGWDVVNHGCAYHAQARTKKRIIYGQHQHAWGGHPLEFRLLIGDESLLAAFCHEWVIPAKHIVPEGMDFTQPITEIMYELRNLAERGQTLDGPTLMLALGGATRVREAVEAANIPADALAVVPTVHTPTDAERAPCFHLPQLLPLLHREARAAEAGQEYPPRVIVSNGYLLLLLRRRVNEQMPRHVIWLDATANERLYEAILQRPVRLIEPRVKMRGRIYQVYDRANGKGALLDGDGNLKNAVQHLKKQASRIARNYRRVGLITHLAIVAQFEDYPERGHFYAERGTNRFGDVDALIVAGVPQPPLFEIDKTARMLFFERMQPFRSTNWSVIDKPYNYVAEDGMGRAYPASGFWSDPDLQAVLWQFREAELVHAAHRARPNLREVDVWLLENLPVDDLPPTRLLAMRDLFDAPPGVNVFEWPNVVALADLYWDDGRALTAEDIAEHIGVTIQTARRYLKKLLEVQPGRWAVDRLVPKGHGGAPRRTLKPRRERGNYELAP